MATVRMKLEGYEHTLRQLARVPEVVQKHAAAAVGRSSIEVANSARVLAAYDTGTLRRSIDWQHADGDLTGWVGVGPDAFYWRFLENGTVNMTARPFFRPAAEGYRSKFEQQFREIGPDIEADMERGR